MESADIVLWRRQGPCGSWLLSFVEHSVGLWNMEGVEEVIEWISSSGERYTPTVRVIREIQGSLFNDPFIEAEIDFRDYTTRIKTYPTVSGKREYDVTPVEHKWSSIIAINEWLHKREEEAKTEGGVEA